MSDAGSEWVGRAETVARDVLAKHAADVDRTARWPAVSIDAIAKAGLLGLIVPASHGGAGEGPRAFSTVLSKLAEACASTGMIYLMHVCGTSVVIAAQNFPKRDAVLKDIAAGKHLSTLAFSEKGSR